MLLVVAWNNVSICEPCHYVVACGLPRAWEPDRVCPSNSTMQRYIPPDAPQPVSTSGLLFVVMLRGWQAARSVYSKQARPPLLFPSLSLIIMLATPSADIQRKRLACCLLSSPSTVGTRIIPTAPRRYRSAMPSKAGAADEICRPARAVPGTRRR